VLSADGGLDVVIEDPDPAWSANRRMIAFGRDRLSTSESAFHGVGDRADRV
jgi:hypothetical protein